jgi:outer membrane protein OmpA-like peptidoglycan-associated protein
MAGRLLANEQLRLQVVAYAAATSEGESQSRRLSLSRALAVRNYLTEKGVRSTRMDVRALGSRAANGPADRVDILIIER